MIKNSWPEFLFMYGIIFLFRSIVPASLAYLPLRYLYIPSHPLIRLVDAYAVVEICFYLFFYLPLKRRSQAPVGEQRLLPRDERRVLFERCIEVVPDLRAFWAKWFNAPIGKVKRENIKHFWRWALLNTGEVQAEHEDELEEYMVSMEKRMGPMPAGYGDVSCVRITMDEVKMLHRPIAWYMLVAGIDFSIFPWLRANGFHFYRPKLAPYPRTFPFRPWTALSPNVSPAKTLSYWFKPSRNASSKRLPLVFMHGIGVGLWTYIPFLKQLSEAADDDVSIIAFELLPISGRVTHATLGTKELLEQVTAILDRHGYDKFVLMSHSYGSLVSSQMIKNPIMRDRIASAILIDPVSILLHLPSVVNIFMRGKPRRANEYELHYFGARDMCVAHSLCRRFVWIDKILWKDDLVHHPSSTITTTSANSTTASTATALDSELVRTPASIFLAGQDLIVDTREVAKYLTGGKLERCIYVDEGRVVEIDESDRLEMWDDVAIDEKRADSAYGSDSEKTKTATLVHVEEVRSPSVEKDDEVHDSIRVFWNEKLDHADVFEPFGKREALLNETLRLMNAER